ncbi:hypothetical protein [Candidatus Methylacidithermus pantelleriae]|uniref:hypothetical protein n=1 Tax=Candidatus Methylacidithermus pantelleriae TaxID=2744239 RepID=UPI00157CC5A8|nr:hypothetical protein [Candidatus Methylacidithermus pantelleriae]
MVRKQDKLFLPDRCRPSEASPDDSSWRRKSVAVFEEPWRICVGQRSLCLRRVNEPAIPGRMTGGPVED